MPEAHTITTENGNNSITWGNNTYTGGNGADTYYFSIVEDVNRFAVMQGFDKITYFNPHEDKIVLNIEKNLFRHLGMQASDDQLTLAQKLDQAVRLSYDSQINGSVISFVGPLGESFGHIELTNFGFWSSLFQIDNTYSFYYGVTPIQIISTGPDYTPPIVNPDALSTFDPVFVKINQAQAFSNFVSNAELESLTWGLANGVVLPPELSFTADGTLHVFETSDGKTPVDAFIQVTVHDDVEPTSIITIPPDPIHIFALNADSGAPFRDASIKGSKNTEIYETNQAGNKIVGGGDDIVYNPTTNPTTPGSAIVYGSKLIYDISEGGHTAIGDVEKIEFTNTATTITTPATGNNTHAVSNLDGQTITFNANMFNINSGSVGAIFGNNTSLVLSANASNNGQGGVIDATIANNVFNFKPTTIYTVGSTSPVAGNSFTAYGIMQTLSLLVHNPDSTITGNIGNASITGNTFNFSANKLVGSSDAMTLNPGIGVLNITNSDTYAHDPSAPNPNPISGNILTFANSTLTSGTGETFFNADIADLSNSEFVTGVVTYRNDATAPVQVTDSHNNVITWGNNTYTILPGNQASTLSFTLLSIGGNDAAMQGHATINGFRANTDTLNLKLAPLLFKALNTNYDRSISLQELNIPGFTQFDSTTSPGNTILSFAPSLAAGSIKFMGQQLTGYNNFVNLTTELAYTPTPITVHNPALGLTPQIFVANGGNGSGVYGNVLDSYFNNIDIGNAGSTYTVTLSDAYPQLIDPLTLLSTSGVGTLFDQYGTASVSEVQSPTLSILNVKPTDVHNPTNNISTDLMVGAFNGTMATDPNTAAGGLFTGHLSAPSYLQGNFANETLIGNAGQLTTSALNQSMLIDGTTYGTDEFGGNMIINTNTGSAAYGVSRDILFSVNTTNMLSPTSIEGDFNVNPNALYVNGTVFGVGDSLVIDVHNSASGTVFDLLGSISATFGSLSGNTISNYNFGAQTIFGQGTLVGDLNSFRINVVENSALAYPPPPTSVSVDVSANVLYNKFTFAPTEIIALGNQSSTIFTHINSLSFFTQYGFVGSIFGVDSQGNTFSQSMNKSANIKYNQFAFEDSIAVGGSGGINYYSDINDLSSTSFWTSEDLRFNNSGSHVSVVDNPIDGSTDVNNNTIVGGNNKVYLSAAAGSPDTIHLNVLQGQNASVGIPGNLDVYNFNPTNDAIRFNISIPMYKALNGGSTTLNGLITAATLDNYAHISSVTNTTINFDYGSLILHDVSGHPTLASFPNIQVGTTLAGNRGVSDAFTVGIPTTFSDFKEVDHITQFNPNQDVLRLALSPTTYGQMGQYGLISGSALLDAIGNNAGTAIGGITITKTPIEYQSADPTNSGASVDSTLNFVTNNLISGSVTLHNVDVPNLQAPFIQLGQQGTAASDTFYFIVPGSDFSTFTGNTFIKDITSNDYIEVAIQKTLYDTITQNGTLSTVAALSANVANNTGGIIAAPSATKTILEFVANNTIYGTIAIEGTNSTLGGLGSSLHLGYIDTATTGVDTFAFNITDPAATFNDFHQFAHITNFDTNQDILQITVPVDL